MAYIKLFTYNLVTQDETVITAASENALFPATNLKDQRTTKVSRSVTATLSNTYVFDFITAQPVDTVLMVPDNLRGFAALTGTVTVEANTINAWGSPAFSTTFSIGSTQQQFKFAFKNFAEQNYRFWRVSVSNSTGYVEVSKIFIGKSVTLADNNIDFGWNYEERDLSTYLRNKYGQKFTDKRNFQKLFRGLKFRLMTVEEMETIVDALSEVKEHTPMWMMVDDESNVSNQAERFATYSYISNISPLENNTVDSFELSFSLEECI